MLYCPIYRSNFKQILHTCIISISSKELKKNILLSKLQPCHFKFLSHQISPNRAIVCEQINIHPKTLCYRISEFNFDFKDLSSSRSLNHLFKAFSLFFLKRTSKTFIFLMYSIISIICLLVLWCWQTTRKANGVCLIFWKFYFHTLLIPSSD